MHFQVLCVLEATHAHHTPNHYTHHNTLLLTQPPPHNRHHELLWRICNDDAVSSTVHFGSAGAAIARHDQGMSTKQTV